MCGEIAQTETERDGDGAFKSIGKAIRAIPSSEGKEFPQSGLTWSTSPLFVRLLADPADNPYGRGVSRYVSVRHRARFS